MNTKRTEDCMICGKELSYLTTATGIRIAIMLNAGILGEKEIHE